MKSPLRRRADEHVDLYRLSGDDPSQDLIVEMTDGGVALDTVQIGPLQKGRLYRSDTLFDLAGSGRDYPDIARSIGEQLQFVGELPPELPDIVDPANLRDAAELLRGSVVELIDSLGEGYSFADERRDLFPGAVPSTSLREILIPKLEMIAVARKRLIGGVDPAWPDCLYMVRKYLDDLLRVLVPAEPEPEPVVESKAKTEPRHAGVPPTPENRELIAIAEAEGLSINQKMERCLANEPKVRAWTGSEWADFLNCTDGNIRQTETWKRLQSEKKAAREQLSKALEQQG